MIDHYRAELARVFAGRRWILAMDVLAGATPFVAQLAKLGAERCFCIGTSKGTGPQPDAECLLVEIEAADMMAGIRRSLDAFAALAPEPLDAFDPKRAARVIGSIFDDGRPVAGRQKYGARRESWRALEDKTLIDAFWDAAAVARAPSRVVPVAELPAVWSELDRGDGVVLAGDNKDGWNGGATYLRWVRSERDLAAVLPFFQAHSERVRVMPFLEGIPCSIHGFVFEGVTIALRPCEMIVLRRPGSTELSYARAASFWDPPDADRAAMRELTVRVGDRLRDSVGYRGAFTVDGVLSRDGFLPTELNPRFGAALALATAKLDLPLFLLNLALVEGEPLDWRPAELERLLLDHMDAHRSGGGLAMTKQRVAETRSASLVWTGDAFRIAMADETPDATAMLGPAPAGGFLRIDLVTERTPVGRSVAPRIAAALACLDAHFGLGIGELEPARDVSAQA